MANILPATRWPKKCRKCAYRASDVAGHTCDYLSITGHARILVSPEAGEHCTAFVPKQKKLRRGAPPPPPQPRKRSERTLIRYRQMRQLYDEGKTDCVIADEVGVSRSTVKRWRLEEGLMPNTVRKEVQ